MQPQANKILCLMGPTAIGKTDLAIELCKKNPIDILSVDSAMVYKGMNIGTGKPSLEELRAAPHKLIDLCMPSESYSAAHFVKDALEEIHKSLALGRHPILVGGTMLYFKALIEGLSVLPSSVPELRSSLTDRMHQEGLHSLYSELERVDQMSALIIKPNDKQRIMRALEVFHQTGRPMSEHLAQSKSAVSHPFKFVCVGLIPDDRLWLHERIAQRFETMLEQGMVDETKNLVDQPNLLEDCPALRSVGYRQIIEYLKGQSTFDEMREKAIAATRQLAKRQLTWLRHWPALHPIVRSKTTKLSELSDLLTAIELS